MTPGPEHLLVHDEALRKLARRLVVDAARADDVVQDAWLAALRRDDSTVSSWAAWLSGTVRRLTQRAQRSADRRAKHESASARPEPAPSAADLVEREAARRRVMDALLALPESYRIAVALRYLDDLPPRKVAARLGVPTETARTRIKRGLELLRERVASDHGGDRRAWGLALAPLAVPKAGAIGATLATATEVLLMNVATKAALVTLAFGGAAWVMWILNPPTSPAIDEAPTTTASANSDATPSDGTDSRAAGTESDATRALVTAASPEPPSNATASAAKGSLAVRVRYASDGAPGAGVGVEVMSFSNTDPFVTTSSAIADREGVARFAELPPGRATVRADRGSEMQTSIVGGTNPELTFELEPGALVEGVVLTSERTPFAGAEIFMSLNGPEAPGYVVGRSREDGSFSVRDVSSAHLIGARAAGYAPSTLALIMGMHGAKHRLELVLRGRGSSVLGHVVDLDGAPIAGADVEAIEVGSGDANKWLDRDDGAMGMQSIGQRTKTASDGTFTFDGLAPTTHRMVARARDFAVTSTTLTPSEGARHECSLQLPPSPILRGRVVDSAGVAVAVGSARVGNWPELDGAWARFDATGSFELKTLPLGPTTVVVWPENEAKTERVVDLVAGRVTELEIRLPPSFAIRGRVVDVADRPCAGLTVRARTMAATRFGADHETTTAEDGSFTLRGCRDEPYGVSVHTPWSISGPVAQKLDVRPSGDEVVLVVDPDALSTGSIVFCVAGPDGLPIGGAQVVPLREGADTASIHATDPTTGCIALQGLVVGRYSLSIQASGFAALQIPVRLRRDEVLDLGTIRLGPPGSVKVDVTGPGATAAAHVVVVGENGERYPVERSSPSGAFSSVALPAGRWTVVVHCETAYAPPMPIEIRAGLETAITVETRAGIQVTAEIEGLTALSGSARPRLLVWAADGALAADRFGWRAAGRDDVSFALVLPPGDYAAQASVDDATDRVSFRVESQPISVHLRPR
ncbi:MAG: sigma-70 family RNA polymerase sigma factor [Planctomycetes bacterium]|nr:sigma-70 family RNA polymerase sigma factor [Planctomycetota bacterium]MCC7170400.1 sigma-70 family RNA polymerase sigma factor [Planctomycetota bacterium]